MSVATGIVRSPIASAKIATDAVTSAMKKANISAANGVLLLLTVELLPYLQKAIRAAATLAKTTQVFGCTATGIFTEDDWVLDCPAAAAIVFGDEVHIGLASKNPNNAPLLTLLSAQDLFEKQGNLYGGITGDVIDQRQFFVWENAKGKLTNSSQTHFIGTKLATGVSHGLTLLSKPNHVDRARGFDIISINQIDAYNDLNNCWHQHTNKKTGLPVANLVAIFADNEADIIAGNFSQSAVISMNANDGSVSLAQAIPTGKVMCWSLYQHKTGQQEVTQITKQLCSELDTSIPDFGLCFSTLSRGPFEDGIDHDLNAIKQLLPSMPLIGFYGNGTISHINDQNQVLSNALVLNLFKIKNTL